MAYDDDEFWSRGPGRHENARELPEYYGGPPSRAGAVVAAYTATGAIERDCAAPPRGCGRTVGEVCVFPDGRERHMPCVARTTPAEHASEPGAGQ